MARTAHNTQTQQASTSNETIILRGPREVALPRLVFILAVFTLTVIGFVMVFSSSTIEAINEGAVATSYLTRQLVAAVLGIMVATFFAVAPYYVWLDRWAWVFLTVVIILLLATAAFGTAELGAQRWLTIGPITFQPSELAKPAFVMMAARILYKWRIEKEYSLARMTATTVFAVGVPLLLLYVTQSDLGTTLICFIGILTALWLSDIPVAVFIGVVLLLAFFVVGAVFTTGYRLDRLSFLNPKDDYYGAGYQLVRSFYAFAEGGIFGVGLGNSTEKYLYLPEAETDFIFAIIAEELGLVGAVVVIALFLVVLWAGLHIARNAPDLFGTMLAGACTVMLVFQAFLNIGCVMGLLPTTGKPLPFISAGGSALIGAFALVGFILSVSFASGSDSGVFERRRNDLLVVRSGNAGARSSGARSSGARSSSSRAQQSSSGRLTRSESSNTSKRLGWRTQQGSAGRSTGSSARAAARNRRR